MAKRSAMLVLAGTLFALAVWSLAGSSPQTAAARPFYTGFYDDVFFNPQLAQRRSGWLERTRRLGGSRVRILVRWRTIAPRRPSNPGNPNDPVYRNRWQPTDAAVRDAVDKGLQPMITVLAAPLWAEAKRNRPSLNVAPAGTWRPDPKALGKFARAIAQRYSGSVGSIPRVRYWQVWNEPNLRQFLMPQWVKRRGGFKPYSPGHYRRMLNAAYAGINSVRRSNVVASAGMAPYGQYRAGADRMPPAQFVRELFCLNDRLRPKCSATTRLDALAQHIYHLGASPFKRAAKPDDVMIPDLARKIGRPLRKAVKSGRAQPAGGKQLWVTEFNWESKPPAGNGIPLGRQAKYLQEAFYLLWRQRVSTALWFRIVDSLAKVPKEFQDRVEMFDDGGIHFRSGNRKPAARAYAFMFVTQRVNPRKIRYWGVAPAHGRVAIQRRAAGRWRTTKRDRTGQSRVYTGTVRLRGSQKMRARMGAQTSLSRKQG